MGCPYALWFHDFHLLSMLLNTSCCAQSALCRRFYQTACQQCLHGKFLAVVSLHISLMRSMIATQIGLDVLVCLWGLLVAAIDFVVFLLLPGDHFTVWRGKKIGILNQHRISTIEGAQPQLGAYGMLQLCYSHANPGPSSCRTFDPSPWVSPLTDSSFVSQMLCLVIVRFLLPYPDSRLFNLMFRSLFQPHL